MNFFQVFLGDPVYNNCNTNKFSNRVHNIALRIYFYLIRFILLSK